MAALIQSLVVSGSRLSTGEPNDTGNVWAFEPGTTSPAILYADADASVVITQPIVLDVGGRISFDTYPDGVWVTAPVRLLIEDVNGDPVTDATFWPSDARTDMLVNENYPDAATVDEALTQIAVSLGGTDGNFLESSGATERPIADVLREISVSVKSFGAVGNGIAIDTSAVQATVNRLVALGGGTVYFPPGTYIIDQAITVTSGTGMRIAGAGLYATIIKTTNGTANGFTVSGCTGIVFQDLDITTTAGSTGSSIATTTSASPRFVRVGGAGSGTGTAFAYGLNLNAASYAYIEDSYINGTTDGMLITDSSDVRVIGGTILGTTYSVEWAGSSNTVRLFGVRMSSAGANGPMRWAASSTGTNFWFYGCNVSSYSMGVATLPAIRQFGGSPISSTISQATGTSFVPTLYAGQEVWLIASSGGVGTATVSAPVILPPLVDGLYYEFVFKNAATGAVTWSLNAVYVVNAAIPTTDAHTIAVKFRWDASTSKLREMSRADTVT